MDRMREFLIGLLVIVLFVFAAGFVGSLDYDEAVRQQDDYCERVRIHALPDYRPDIKCPIPGDVAAFDLKGSN